LTKEKYSHYYNDNICRNPISFEFTTKAKESQGCGPKGNSRIKAKKSQGCGPKRNSEVTSQAPGSVKKCEGV